MSAGENVATITVLMTIVFSMIVLGWALFYKCTDSTFKTEDLAVEKCFSFMAVPKKEEPEVIETDEPVAFFPTLARVLVWLVLATQTKK